MNSKIKNLFIDGLTRDIAIVFLSIIVAVILANTGALNRILLATQEAKFIGSFLAGFFMASMFTVAPATVAIAEIARSNSLLETVVVGATGTMLGDLLIFRFFKDRLSRHIGTIITRFSKKESGKKHTRKIIQYALPIIGAFLIASPLPDEAGLALMGLTKVKTSWLVIISLVLNMIGITVIALIARSI